MADLKGRSVRGGAITLILQGFKFAFQLGSTVVLARLLTPADFGLVAMVTAVTGFVAMFKDLGLSQATVQRQHITHAQVSTLFWINVALSVVLMLAVMGLAPLITWFYDEPRLAPITLALAATFIFGGLTVQHGALLIRQMRFATASAIDVGSMAIGVLAAVLIAYRTHSYWSLVVLPATQSATHCIFTLIVSRWLPGLPQRGAGVRSMLRFGGYLAGFSLVNYFSRNADKVLIGWYWGAAALGIYARAHTLMMLPISQISGPIQRVGVNTLSRLVAQPREYARYYLNAINRICWMTAPLVAILVACADEVVALMLGPGWEFAAGVLRILGITAFIQPIYNSIGWIFTSTGRSDRFFRWSLVAMPITIAGFAVGLPWGINGVAWGYVIAFCLGIIPWTFFYTFRDTALTVRALVGHIAPPYSIAAIVFITACMTRARLDFPPAVVLMLSTLIATAVAVPIVLLIAPLRRDAGRLLRSVAILRTRPLPG